MIAPESVACPSVYYENNVSSLPSLASVLRGRGSRFVFSSSGAVYAPNPAVGVDENSPLAPGNSYARTKLAGEWILKDLADSGALEGYEHAEIVPG